MCRTENGMLIQKLSRDGYDFRRRGIISNSVDSIQFNRCFLIAGVGKELQRTLACFKCFEKGNKL